MDVSGGAYNHSHVRNTIWQHLWYGLDGNRTEAGRPLRSLNHWHGQKVEEDLHQGS
jgi:DNA mismatch repair protein MutH